MQILKKISPQVVKITLLFTVVFSASSLLVPATAYGANPCDNTKTPAALRNCLKKNPVTKQIQNIINFLSAAVGIVIVGMLAVGGIQYMSAGENTNAVVEARKKITNALIALAVFIFLGAFLQWLIPGGIFD